jgi:hypothetical protein
VLSVECWVLSVECRGLKGVGDACLLERADEGGRLFLEERREVVRARDCDVFVRPATIPAQIRTIHNQKGQFP